MAENLLGVARTHGERRAQAPGGAAKWRSARIPCGARRSPRAPIERGGGATAERVPAAGQNPFSGVAELPTIKDAVELLVEEALSRGGGNQTIAARLLGVTQSALSKRLKAARDG